MTHFADPPISRTGSGDIDVVPTGWGRLEWRFSEALGNSDHLTVGHCLINPGEQNGRHYHPNCDEILFVLRGSIVHSWGDTTIEMHTGDMISIPAEVHHNARNIGDDVAEMLICFSSAKRETIDVETA